MPFPIPLQTQTINQLLHTTKMANVTTTSGSTTAQARPGPKTPAMARTICLAVVFLLVLVGLVVLITWAVLRPKKIVVSIDQAAVHEYGLVNSRLNSTFEFTMRVYNPNHRASVYYDTFQVYVEYAGQPVATRVMSPFFEGHKDGTLLKTELVARNVLLNDSNEKDLKRERTGGSVDLDVRVRGKIRFRVGKWKSGHYKLKVLCSPVVVFSNPKSFKPVNCEVDL